MRGVQARPGRARLETNLGRAFAVPTDDSLEPHPSVQLHAHMPGFSLLRASTGRRLVLVALMLAVLWLAVLWALR